MKIISGGVTAAKGFKAGGIHCGIRKNKLKKDLALIYSVNLASAVSVYTTNLVKGAPIYVTQENIKDGYAQAIICNSGNANTCNADGMEIANKMCSLVAEKLKIKKEDVIVASTGVIGQPLLIEPIASHMDELVNSLGANSDDAARAIMTTDLTKKEIAVLFEIEGIECHIGGIAKGSGMIHPDMATMLAFITTDVAIIPSMLQKAINEDVEKTFNMISVDGVTSTNDMLSILANGASGIKAIEEEDKNYHIFQKALNIVTTYLCKGIASDGEGATKLLECNVSNANSLDSARKVSKSVICSNLFKAAMFGADANWGRILCAVGSSGADVNINKVDVSFISAKGKIAVCKDGAGIPFSEEIAKNILLEKEIIIDINLNDGLFKATAWGCDLTYDYVKINGDYRS